MMDNTLSLLHEPGYKFSFSFFFILILIYIVHASESIVEKHGVEFERDSFEEEKSDFNVGDKHFTIFIF